MREELEALEGVNRLLMAFRGLEKIKIELTNLTQVRQAEAETKTRVALLLKQEHELMNTIASLDKEAKALKARNAELLAKAKLEAQAIIDKANEDARGIFDRACTEKDKLIRAGESQLSVIQDEIAKAEKSLLQLNDEIAAARTRYDSIQMQLNALLTRVSG